MVNRDQQMRNAIRLARDWLADPGPYPADIDAVREILKAAMHGRFGRLERACAVAWVSFGEVWHLGDDPHYGLIPDEIRQADPAHPLDCAACIAKDQRLAGMAANDRR